MNARIAGFALFLIASAPSSGSAQKSCPGGNRSLHARLDCTEALYHQAITGSLNGRQERAMWLSSIRSDSADILLAKQKIPDDSRYERAACELLERLLANLEYLVRVIDPSSMDHPARRPLRLKTRAAIIKKENATSVVHDVTAFVLEEIDPIVDGIDAMSRESYSHARTSSWRNEVSHSYVAFRSIREDLFELVDKACQARDPLCAALEPSRAGARVAVVTTAYSRDIYGVGIVITKPPVPLLRNPRIVAGVQALTDLPALDEAAVELSVGGMFGDFALMPGVMISPRSHRALGLSASVLYMPRSRISVGASFSTDYGAGIRVVYAFRPPRT